jgi:signal transduction histidine kinase
VIRLSVTARIALLSIALALVTNVALVLFVRQQLHQNAIAALRRDATEQADTLVAVYRSGGVYALRQAIADAESPQDPTLVLAVLDANGHKLLGDAPPAMRPWLRETVAFRIGRIGRTSPWAQIATGYSLRPIGHDWLLAGRMLTDWEAEQRGIERALLLALGLSLALGIVAGLVVTRYVVGRLGRLADTIGLVAEGDLSRRAPETVGGDAFDRLARQLNAMLDKLERLMAELRIVTDSLAHDLRSPLARLRTRTENALLLPDSEQRDGALSGLLAETDIIMRMLSMLIEISRSEAVSRDRFTTIDPAALIEEIGELYEPVAEDAGLHLSVAIEGQPRPLALHRELMTQALTNLIDNALRHAASGRAVALRLIQERNALVFQVEDRGPGIAERDREQALRRFGRLDTARTAPGAGLGLSLIQAVAQLHGGSFDLDNNAPGLIARIRLPT